MKIKEVSYGVLLGLFIVGAVFVYMSCGDLKRNNTTPVDFNTLTVADLEDELIVEGELWCNYGAFMEEYSTRNGVKVGDSKYKYLFPISDTQFMAIEPQNDEMDAYFDKQANETIAYILGESSAEPGSVHIKGRIKRLDSASMGYMKEYLISLGYTQNNVQSAVCAYYIDCETYDNWWIGFIIGLGFIALSIGLLIHTAYPMGRRKKVAAVPSESPMPASTSYENFTPYQPTTTVHDASEHPDYYNTPSSTLVPEESQEQSEQTQEKSASGFSLKLDD